MLPCRRVLSPCEAIRSVGKSFDRCLTEGVLTERELRWSVLGTCIAHTMRTLIDLGPKLRGSPHLKMTSAIYLQKIDHSKDPFELSTQYFEGIRNLKNVLVRDSDSF